MDEITGGMSLKGACSVPCCVHHVGRYNACSGLRECSVRLQSVGGIWERATDMISMRAVARHGSGTRGVFKRNTGPPDCREQYRERKITRRERMLRWLNKEQTCHAFIL